MLPPELLSVLFGALSRADLEAVMLVNSVFRDIVMRDFGVEPLRHITELYVARHREYEFRFATISDDGTAEEQWYTSRNDEDFHQRMRLVQIGTLHFGESTFDEASFDALLPHKDDWRHGRVCTPCHFASQLLLERAFTELFFCTDMFVLVDDEYELSRPFMTFPAIRQCIEVDSECPSISDRCRGNDRLAER